MAPESRDERRNTGIQIGIGIVILVLLVLLPVVLAPSPPQGAVHPAADSGPVKVRILAVNDFHGQLPAGKKMNDTPVGSAPVLASYLRSGMERNDVSATFLALPGDLIGASPPDSGLLLDEPTVLLFNTFADACNNVSGPAPAQECGVIATFGNHEFDHGLPELQRMVAGGNGSTTIPHLVDPYPGSNATYVCANVVWTVNQTPLAAPYVIRNVSGIPVAFIGADTMQTTGLTLPANYAGLSFLNETEAVNRYVAEVRGNGVHAVVVLLHEGGSQDSYEGYTRTGTNVSGRITGIVAGLDPDIDIVLSAHTHDFTNAYLNNSGGRPVLVTQAYNYSTAFAQIEFTLDPKTGDITEKTARIVPAYADRLPGSDPDPAAARILDEADAAVLSITGRVIATASGDITSDESPAGESALGDLVADSLRAAMGTDMGVITSGSLRTDRIAKGNVTWGDLYAVQPFSSIVLSENLTGKQVLALLERQWESPLPPHNLGLSGLTYAWDPARPPGSRVSDVTIGGAPLSPERTYSVALVEYLASGGDRYSVLAEGTDVNRSGRTDVEVLASYIGSLPQPVNGTIKPRITVR